jgi:hypothetical protein
VVEPFEAFEYAEAFPQGRCGQISICLRTDTSYPVLLPSLATLRANLHLVLAMSPVGGAFRERLRKWVAALSPLLLLDAIGAHVCPPCRCFGCSSHLTSI